jgi:hypothetical protein
MRPFSNNPMKPTAALHSPAVEAVIPAQAFADSEPQPPAKPRGAQDLCDPQEAMRTRIPPKRSHEGNPAPRLRSRAAVKALSLKPLQK